MALRREPRLASEAKYLVSSCYTPPLYVIHFKGGLNSGEAQLEQHVDRLDSNQKVGGMSRCKWHPGKQVVFVAENF